MTTGTKEAINLKDGGSIKSEIPEMISMGFKSESTENNHNKSENIWNDCSENTISFTTLNNTEKNILRVQVGHSWQ